MESWIIADLDVLAAFYEKDFNGSAIPKNTNVEQVEKHAVAKALDQETQHYFKH